MNNKIITFSSLALLGCVISQSTQADDYLDLSIEQLLNAKILSVSKKIETLAEAPAAIYVITSDDLQRSGVSTVADALRSVPGVVVAKSDSNSWAVSIRGFNSTLANKLLVLIDGRTIYNPVFGGVLWEAHDLMLEDIDRIEIIRGPGGTLWGANAVNGVINIITKTAQDTKNNLVSVVYGNEERGTLSMRHGGELSNAGAYRVYAKLFTRDASQKPIGDTYTDNYDEWDGFRTGFRADWNNQFTLQGDAYRTNSEQLRPDFSFTPPFSSVERQTIIYEGVNLLGRWTQNHTSGSQLTIQTYIDWAKRDEPFNFIDDRVTYDIEAQYNWETLANHEIITGAGYRLLTDDEIGNNNVSFSPQKRRSSLYNIFIQDKITISPDAWFLTLGSKFEENEFSGFEVQPNIRLQWQVNPNQNFWSSISKAVRTPTPIEEDLTSTLATANAARIAFVPNDDFKSEELVAYELGYRQQLSATLSMDLASFYNDYKYLGTTTVQTPSIVNNGVDPLHLFIPVKFTNNMTGTSSGFETAFNWSPQQNIKFSAAYSYLHMSLTAMDPTQEGAEDIYPAHQGSLSVFWDINNVWSVTTTAHYVDQLEGFAIPAHTSFALNISANIQKYLRFTLIGQNLTDSSHREFGSASDLNMGEIERSIFGKLTWQF